MWEKSNDPEMVQMRKGYPSEKRAAYLNAYTRIDGIRYVPHAAPVRFERYFDDQSMNAYLAAASEPKRISWYPAGHDRSDPAAGAGRACWLVR